MQPGPGSFLEVAKVLPLWTEPGAKHPSFDVVALSLPGFGFSEAPNRRGFHLNQYAEVSVALLSGLHDLDLVDDGGL